MITMKAKARKTGLQRVLDAHNEVAHAAEEAGKAAESARAAVLEAEKCASRAAEAAKSADRALKESAMAKSAAWVRSSKRTKAKPSSGDGQLRLAAAVLAAVAGASAVERVWGTKFDEVIDRIDISRLQQGGFLALAAVTLLVVALTGLTLLNPAMWSAVVVAYGCFTWLLLNDAASEELTKEARAVAVGCLSVGLLLIVAGLMFGEDETVTSALSLKTSSASTVLMLWTIIMVYAVAYIAALASIGGGPVTCSGSMDKNCIEQSAWTDYLVLLGVPGAAAAYAKSRGLTGKTSESDKSNSDVSNVQYFVFNVVAILFVAGGLWQHGRLDEVPDVLLGLTGASALTYALVKPEEGKTMS